MMDRTCLLLELPAYYLDSLTMQLLSKKDWSPWDLNHDCKQCCPTL